MDSFIPNVQSSSELPPPNYFDSLQLSTNGSINDHQLPNYADIIQNQRYPSLSPPPPPYCQIAQLTVANDDSTNLSAIVRD